MIHALVEGAGAMARRALVPCLLLTLLARPASAQAPPPEPEDEEATSEAPADGSTAGEAPEGAASQPKAAAADTVQNLEAGSGVRVQAICTNCNQANLTVNGVTGDAHVRVLLDGFPAIGGLGTVYDLMQFPAELIGHSHVLRGPGSVLSGSGGMGGAIELHSVEPTTEAKALLDARIGDWGSRSLKLGGADRWGPVGALVFLQGVRQHGVDATGDRDDFGTGNELPEFERVTAHGIFDFHLTDRQKITLRLMSYGEPQRHGPGRPFGSFRDPETSFFAEEDVKLNLQNHGLSWHWDGESGLQLDVDAGWSRRYQAQIAPVIRGGDAENYLRVLDERVHSEARATLPIGKSGLLTAGTSYDKLQVRVFSFESIFVPWITDGLEQFSTYAEWSQQASDKWTYSAGLRYDDFVVFGWTTPRDSERIKDPDIPSSYLLPRAQVQYRPRTDLLFSLAAGRFAVGQTPVVEKTCCGAQYSRSRLLLPERAWSYQSQVEWHPTQDMRFTTTLFHSDFKDYIERQVESATFFVPTYANRNIPRVKVEGIDFVHDMRFADNLFNVGWTYTWSDATQGDGTRARYLARQAASGYLRYNDVRRGTKINFDIRYTGGVRHYELPSSPAPTVTLGDRVSDAFTTADLSFEQRVGKKGWAVQGGVVNITDYVMSDLTNEDADLDGYRDQFDRVHDWGPISGRFIWGGMKFVR